MIDIANFHASQLTKLRKSLAEKAQTSSLHEAIRLGDKDHTPLSLASNNVEIRSLSDAEKKEQWSQKVLLGRHHSDLHQPHINREASKEWLSDRLLFPETERFMIAFQNQVISTNNYKNYVIKDPNTTTDKCRKCHQKFETVQHITSGFTYLANTDYLHRHNQVCNIYQKLANKYGILNSYTPYYRYQPHAVF